MSEKPEIEVDD